MFKRVDDDLVMVKNITLEQALLGTTVVVDTIDHRTIRVPITDIVRYVHRGHWIVSTTSF